MKNLFDNVKLILEMGIIGIILLYVGTLVIMPEATMGIFQFQSFIVVTESMEPEINVNDMVVATKFNIDEAEVGDIITFYADIDYNGTMEVVTHYIYSIDESGEEPIIRTHRHFEDPTAVSPDTWLIPASDVIGTYSFHVQYVGFVINFFKTWYGLAVIAGNMIIFGIIRFMRYRDNKKEQERQDELEKLAMEQAIAESNKETADINRELELKIAQLRAEAELKKKELELNNQES